MAKTSNNATPGFKVAVGKVSAKGQAQVQMGACTLGFTRLALPREVKDDDTYAAVSILDKEQRELLIIELIPAAVEAAANAGIKCTAKEAEVELRKKIKETEEGSGSYRCSADQRMVFRHKDGEDSYPTVIVLGPDGEHYPEARLVTNGTIAYINFTLVAVVNSKTGKAIFPFRLTAVKIKDPVLYEVSEKPAAVADFSQVEDDY